MGASAYVCRSYVDASTYMYVCRQFNQLFDDF